MSRWAMAGGGGSSAKCLELMEEGLRYVGEHKALPAWLPLEKVGCSWAREQPE